MACPMEPAAHNDRGEGMRTFAVIALSAASLLGGCSANAQSVRSLINDGNDLYAEKKYADAEVNYRKALERDITSLPGHFNLGNALYRQEKFDESITKFEDAVRKSETPTAKAKAFYNLGDAYLKSQKYEEAVKAFTESLKLNPHDFDAKYNLSYALTKLRDQQQNQKSDKNKQDQNKQDQNKQDQQNRKQEQQNQDQQKDQQQRDQQQNRQQDQQRAQQPKQQEKMMSKADAERILEVLKNSEKDVQKKLRQRVAGRPKTEKDW